MGLRVAAMLVVTFACATIGPVQADGTSTVEFRGQSYQLPLGPSADVRRLGDAAEVDLPTTFWNSLYHGPAMATGWQTEPGEMPLRLTLPDKSYVWSPGHEAGRPPVPQTLVSDGVRRGVHVWEDTASHAPFGRLLLTYAGRTDFYVVCDRRQIWNQQSSCDLVWNDAGVLAVFPVYGNLISYAPSVLDAFVAAIRPQGRPMPP
ncbi:MAG: hypothetical protein ACRYHQ_10085 [Janthinobacterium lividum]